MIGRLKNIFSRKNTRKLEEGEIDYREFKAREKEGEILLDVRSIQEYREGHLDGAISIPEYEIKKRVEQELPNKGQMILIYCSSGIRSKIAYDEMKNLGYFNIYHLKYGITYYNTEL